MTLTEMQVPLTALLGMRFGGARCLSNRLSADVMRRL